MATYECPDCGYFIADDTDDADGFDELVDAHEQRHHEASSYRYRVFKRNGNVYLGRYGSPHVTICTDFNLAYLVVRQLNTPRVDAPWPFGGYSTMPEPLAADRAPESIDAWLGAWSLRPEQVTS